jgi:hypothetical protein
MNELIMRSEAMALINSGKPFDLEFITADRRRGTGGKIISLKGWMKLREDMPAEAFPGYTKKIALKRDKANHQNKTFTVFNPQNKAVHPHTVHYRLMQVLNGKRIING